MFRLSCSVILIGFFIWPAASQVVVTTGTPQVGSPNPVIAEPLVPRPHSKPCVVELFQNLEFADFSAKTFNFTPPSDCKGPWSKVVFTADFTVTACSSIRPHRRLLSGSRKYLLRNHRRTQCRRKPFLARGA